MLLPILLIACLTKLSTQVVVCTDPTYYYNSNLGYCILCSFGCLECCDENLCSKCGAGYVLSSTSGLCMACPQNCLACTETFSCTTCANGTTASGGSCIGCSNGCSACTNATYCTTCSPGYYLTANHTCGPCPTGTLTCSFAAGTGYTNNTCQDDYYLGGGACNKCQPPC